MGKNSAIEWTDHTLNPWWGCTKVSDGCKNCYAEKLSNRFGHDVWGNDKPRRFLSDNYWKQPERWNQHAINDEKRYKVFVGSMCDIFEETPYVLDPQRDALRNARVRLAQAIKDTPHLDWLLLTKRPENISKVATSEFGWMTPTAVWDIPDNVWLGVSVENQEMAEKRIPLLLDIPAKVRFLSCEPLLGEIGFHDYFWEEAGPEWAGENVSEGIDWVIVGPESGTNRRNMEISWAEDISEQCLEASVPFFMKGHKVMDIPETLDIQEFPNV